MKVQGPAHMDMVSGVRVRVERVGGCDWVRLDGGGWGMVLHLDPVDGPERAVDGSSEGAYSGSINETGKSELQVLRRDGLTSGRRRPRSVR